MRFRHRSFRRRGYRPSRRRFVSRRRGRSSSRRGIRVGYRM